MEVDVAQQATISSTISSSSGSSSSPTAVLRTEMNRLNLINESEEKVYEVEKVIFDKDHKICTICYHNMHRGDICVLECGHCFHFMCATKWWRGTISNDDGEAMERHTCSWCNHIQNEPPITLRGSLKIIGK